MTAATTDLSKLSQQELIAMVQKLQGEVHAKEKEVEGLTAEAAAWREAMIENLPAIQLSLIHISEPTRP